MFYVIIDSVYKYHIDLCLVFVMQETVRNLDEAAIAVAASAPVATFASPTAVKCVITFHFLFFLQLPYSFYSFLSTFFHFILPFMQGLDGTRG